MQSDPLDLPIEALRKLAQGLASLDIPYAIIGGVAVSINSVPRYTKDVDALVQHAGTDVANLVVGLAAFGLSSLVEDPGAFARKNRMVLLRDEGGMTIDISLGVLPFEIETIETSRTIEVSPGLSVPIATPEALVVMKAVASRPKDLEDIRNLLSVNTDLDREKALATVREFAEILEHPAMVEQLEKLFREIPVF